jgi:hypothetical protein
MKNRHLKLIGILTILISTLLSASICFAFRQHIVSVDLIKILNAQAFYANKLILKDSQNKSWVNSLKDVNASIRQKIKLIAGQDTIVMVTPALIQGTDDITNRVLVALGLPSNLPEVKNFTMPNYKPTSLNE